MTTPTTHPTLADFILAQLDREQAALTGLVDDGWHARGLDVVDQDGWVVARATTLPEHAAHIARHDPARVLAQVAAVRRVVELHAQDDERDAGEPTCRACYDNSATEVSAFDPLYPCPTLRALAAPYAGADGWRSEWAT